LSRLFDFFVFYLIGFLHRLEVIFSTVTNIHVFLFLFTLSTVARHCMDKYLDPSSDLVLSLPSIGRRTNEKIAKENCSLLSAIKKINSLSKSEEIILNQSYDLDSIILSDKNIHLLKNSLIMQESTDLHWFTEESFK